MSHELTERRLTITLHADASLLHVVTSFAEQAGLALGLAEPEALALTLATEEIFAYLCGASTSGKPVEVQCRGGGYFVEAVFLFDGSDFSMRAFNLTASASADEAALGDETGLLIASRMVDRFKFSQANADLRLSLTKERAYPLIDALERPAPARLKEFSVRAPEPEELKLFVHEVHRSYPPHLYPPSFSFPGKIVDMVACGTHQAAVAMDAAGHLGGGILWRWDEESLVQFYGPYLFHQPGAADMGQALVEACLSAIARTRAIGLMTRHPTPELPVHYFESLGSLFLYNPNTEPLEIRAYYRHLQEDAGSAVWTHPAVEDFLRREYARLFFARDLNLVRDAGESASDFSVLAAEFNRGAGRVILHPAWWGTDAVRNTAEHVALLRREEYRNIFFEMDLGKPWHCNFTPAVLEAGFEPRYVLPYAGRSDLVIFQHRADGDQA